MKVTTEKVFYTLFSMGRPTKARERYVLQVLNKRFADAMDSRALEKQEAGFVVGWDDPDAWTDEAGNSKVRQHINNAAKEGRWTDVANLAMFAWNLEDD